LKKDNRQEQNKMKKWMDAEHSNQRSEGKSKSRRLGRRGLEEDQLVRVSAAIVLAG
jgi:hypothetical protein